MYNTWTSSLFNIVEDLESVLFNQRLFADNDKGILQMVLPGYEKEDVNIKIEGDSLIVSCDKDFAKDEYWRKKFKKAYTLSGLVDRNSVKAELKNGILSVSIAKDKAKTTNVNIN